MDNAVFQAEQHGDVVHLAAEARAIPGEHIFDSSRVEAVFARPSRNDEPFLRQFHTPTGDPDGVQGLTPRLFIPGCGLGGGVVHGGLRDLASNCAEGVGNNRLRQGEWRKFMTFGERLRVERDRLGKSQAEMGKIAGVTRSTQGLYETEANSPTVAYLYAVAEAGADLHFLIFGTPASDQLAPTEGRLVEILRTLSEPAQQALIAIAEQLANPHAKG